MSRLAAAIALATLAACGGSSGNKTTPPPPPPPPTPVDVTTFQAASTLLGQNDWSSLPTANPCGPGTLSQPTGAAAWTGSALLVPDTFSGRLLAFSPIPPAESEAASMPSASWEIGEPTGLTTCNDASSTLVAPQAPSVTGTALVVADSGLNQVLIFAPVPGASGAAAPATVIGAAGGGCAADSLLDPRGAVLAGITLIVADAGNNRVLLFEPDAHDLSKYVLAMVLGQLDATNTGTRCAYNDTDGDGVPGAAPDDRTMKQPKAVWTDGTRLIVADSGNNRLLVWNSFPTASGQRADAVIGQASFTAAATGASASELWDPESIASDGTKLFVADTGNNRVVVFPSIPSTSTPAATIVLGQADFGCSFPNDSGDGTTCNGAAGAAPSQRTLSSPTGVAVVDGLLAITDTGNGRVLVYRPPAP